MQSTSQTWKTLWASGNARLETKAVINGTEYTEISNPSINRALMQNGCSIGNAVSATCIFAVRTNASIPKSAEVVIKFRLTDGTTTSEWLNAGTFYIAHRSRDPVTGVLKLECYDALLKANAPMPKLMPWTTKSGEVMRTQSGEAIYLNAHYPRKMSAVLADLAILLAGEIDLDPNTSVETGDDYVLTADDVPAGTTINQMLCKIAAANGGNWIMSPDNLLKMVPVKSAAGAAGASSGVVDVDAITKGIQTSSTSTITGVRYYAGAEPFVIGTETGLVIEANTSAAIASDLAEKLVGMTYQAYEIKSAIYDPAAELGDYVRAGANGEVSAVLCAETATYGLAYRGDISAPEIGELSDEYPYIGADFDTVDIVNEAVQALDNSLTQQEIFDRLTDGGTTQGISLKPALTPALGANTPKRVFLNVDYVDDGEMAFDHLRGGTLTLGGLNNASGQLRILDADGNVIVSGSYSGLDINGGRYSSKSSDGQSMMELNAGVLKFYRLVDGTFHEVCELNVSTSGLLGTRVASQNQMIVDVYNSDGFTARVYENNSDFETYGVLTTLKDSLYFSMFNSGNNIGGFGVGGEGGTFSLKVSDGSYFYTGASGTFTAGGKTITVTNGIITDIS